MVKISFSVLNKTVKTKSIQGAFKVVEPQKLDLRQK